MLSEGIILRFVFTQIFYGSAELYNKQCVKIKDCLIRISFVLSQEIVSMFFFNSVEALINGEKEDVDLMLRNFHNSSESLHQVMTSFVIMKK